MKFTKIPVDAFQNIQLNAGIIVDSFNPETMVIGRQLGATTGGVNFTATPNFTDFGEDIDNCPKNTKELKNLESWDVALASTFVTLDATTAKGLVAAADIDPNNASHIIPRNELLDTDFQEVWWIGDYSDVNTGDAAGYCAIHLMNALNTGGFQIQSTDKAKGNFAFTYTGHYSINDQDTVPFEIYVKRGTPAVVPGINLDKHIVAITTEETASLVATTSPASQTVTWASANSEVATVSNGTISPEGAGNTIISASITVDGVTYNDTCTVIVTAAAEG